MKTILTFKIFASPKCCGKPIGYGYGYINCSSFDEITNGRGLDICFSPDPKKERYFGAYTYCQGSCGKTLSVWDEHERGAGTSQPLPSKK